MNSKKSSCRWNENVVLNEPHKSVVKSGSGEEKERFIPGWASSLDASNVASVEAGLVADGLVEQQKPEKRRIGVEERDIVVIDDDVHIDGGNVLRKLQCKANGF